MKKTAITVTAANSIDIITNRVSNRYFLTQGCDLEDAKQTVRDFLNKEYAGSFVHDTPDVDVAKFLHIQFSNWHTTAKDWREQFPDLAGFLYKDTDRVVEIPEEMYMEVAEYAHKMERESKNAEYEK